MAGVYGEATGPAGKKQALFLEALQNALQNAPPPPPGTEVQHFRVETIEMEHGGFTGATRTRVRLDVQLGPLR